MCCLGASEERLLPFFFPEHNEDVSSASPEENWVGWYSKGSRHWSTGPSGSAEAPPSVI